MKYDVIFVKRFQHYLSHNLQSKILPAPSFSLYTNVKRYLDIPWHALDRIKRKKREKK